MHILVISGSLRKDSYNTKLSQAFIDHAPNNVTAAILDISQLPFVNEDLEADWPESVTALKDAIKKADGVIFVTPEYNRSYSPVLKNAIDWASRPYEENVWDGMPAAVAGATIYNLGAFGAQYHLRQVLTFLNMPTLQQPEFFLSNAADKFDSQGKLTDEHTVEKIEELWSVFVPWVERNTRK